ncbi:MAG: hypothetical protein KC420_00570, partial [Myxococcales bacterium]|nr:hypothetical protein [Myxococcales bacterium]
RRATYEDVLAVPPGVVAEVVYGVLHTHPRPALRHANASSNLGVLLGSPFRLGRGGPGGWVIYDEPELHPSPSTRSSSRSRSSGSARPS